MPIFRLKPVLAHLDEPIWASSPVRAECWVNAVDEAEARGMASARFQDASAPLPGHNPVPSAWRDPRLVTATVDDSGEVKLPYGTVLDSGPHM